MGKTWVSNKFTVFQQFHCFGSGNGKWYNLVIFTMQHKHRNIYAFEIFGKICF